MAAHRRLKRVRAIFVRLAFICLSPLVACGQHALLAKTRPITVADAITMTRLGDDRYFSGGSSTGRVAHFSPDGKWFVVILEKGNLERNTNDASLLLYQTADVFHSPQPDVLLTMSSSSSRPYRGAIREIRWLNNETLAFLGENPNEPSQVYTFNITTRTLRKLTSHPQTITDFDMTKDGREVVFAAEPLTKNMETDKERREGVVIANQFLEELVSGEPLYPDAQLYIQSSGRGPLKIPTEVRIQYTGLISISPNGRYGLVGVWVQDVPPDWIGYEDKFIHSIAASQRKGQLVPLSRYLLLDTTNGSMVPLLNAPNPAQGGFPKFVWAPDSQSVTLKTYLPLDVNDPAERVARSKNVMSVEVDLKTRQFRKIAEEMLVARLTRQEEGNADIEVTLDEDMNTPPRIYASDPKTKQKVLLFDLNPQFSELRFGRVESIAWKTTDGNEQRGGLFLPPDYRLGTRYPLVIQTHGFNPNRFSMDGLNEWSSAFAARMLASKGFVVLQAGKVSVSNTGTTNEAPAYMAGYEGAIDDLDKRGLIDRSRVGISGFSRTVLTVGYTLTHSKYRFDAAVLVDGINGGYFQYIAWGNDREAEEDGALLNGGRPFGDRLQLWLKNSPGFNLDKVRAPVRVVALGPPSVLVMWEWFCGLLLQDKPVDFIEIPDGDHLLKKPWQRRIAMQGVVDWFCFWLKGEEDPNPAKVEQYARWEQLRKGYSAIR